MLKIDVSQFKKAVKIMQKGGVLVYPTETVYGLGCDPFNKKAVEMVYKIKGREFNKPLILLAENRAVVERNFSLNKKEKDLMQKFWPGALSLILKPKERLKKQLSQKYFKQKIAVRVSPNKFACRLAHGLDGFIVSTSANYSGKPDCYSYSAIKDQFKNKKNKPYAIFNVGRLKKGKPSTVVEVKGNELVVLRQGDVEIS